MWWAGARPALGDQSPAQRHCYQFLGVQLCWTADLCCFERLGRKQLKISQQFNLKTYQAQQAQHPTRFFPDNTQEQANSSTDVLMRPLPLKLLCHTIAAPSQPACSGGAPLTSSRSPWQEAS